MATPNNHRVAAAFQGGKDPQQDAIIAWLGMLPKDTRGGIKRSVMKYHMTRALLMYMQSGSDVSALVAAHPRPLLLFPRLGLLPWLRPEQSPHQLPRRILSPRRHPMHPRRYRPLYLRLLRSLPRLRFQRLAMESKPKA